MVLLALLFTTLTLGSVPADLVLRGLVRDQSGLPVPRVLVYVDGTQISTETDNAGRFELSLADARAGTLTVFRDGFSAVSVPFDALALEPFQIELIPAPISDSVTVTAPRRPAPPASAYGLRPLDVVRTPGAMGDLMRALQTLPGVAQADEGAGLYVRGGDTSEVLVLLDDAVVFHPYRQETPGGGVFGSVEPFLLEGVSFATGGFSAKYGNALSAVLDMHGLKRPDTPQANVTVGLAGASMRAALPIGERGGVRVSANRSFPGLLFAVNGRPYDFNPLPGGWDVNASAHYNSPSAGTFKLFASAAGDHVGVGIDSLNFSGLLKSSTSSNIASLHWEKVLGGAWLATGTVGLTRYVRGLDVGVKNLDTTDLRASWRATAERAVGAWIVRVGGDGIDARTHLDGVVPSSADDLGGTAGAQPIAVRYGDTVAGAYVEGARRIGRVTATAGGRVERFGLAGEAAIDPRLNVTIDTAPHQKLSLAGGLYHQAPEPVYYGYVGDAGLQPMRARHLIAGYEIGGESDAVHLRAEGYWKTYDALPLETSRNVFTSTGYGGAHGLDLFAHVKHAPFDLTATYSWLSAERRWTAAADYGKFTLPSTGTWHPEFEIPHTAHVLARYDMTRKLSASAGWRLSSGRLDTPIVGGTATPAGYVPSYGAIDSERLPHYARTDLTVSYLSQVRGARSALLFASVGNMFGRANFFGYAYSADYTQRRPVTSATPRVVYFGITLTR
jgi:carboxypeptidase family protein/TonB-dependent receptor-like protein